MSTDFSFEQPDLPFRPDSVTDPFVLGDCDDALPGAIRFAWRPTGIVNLVNSYGIPAQTFRAGSARR